MPMACTGEPSLDAAIASADGVGYSLFMGRNDSATGY
jgi:hypothetical protein